MLIVKTFVAHLLLLAALLSSASADRQEAKSTVSALYTLAGIKRELANAQLSYAVESRSLPKTPEGTKQGQYLGRQFEEQQTNLWMKALELAKANPTSTAGFAALEWILTDSDSYNIPLAIPALKLLTRQYSEHPNIGYVIANLAFYLPSEDSLSRPPSLELLNKVAAKNPDRTARGQAVFGLATIAKDKFKQAENVQSSDVDRLAEQAQEAFELVARDYGSCLYLRTVGIRSAKSTLGEEAKSELGELRFLRIGQIAPEIRGEDLSGAKFSLSDYRGKVVLLVFWASWCGPCMAAIPHEKELVERFKGRPFVLIGVNGDGGTNAAKVVSEHQIPWRSFSNEGRGPDGPIAVDWNVRAWPAVFVLDPTGVIRYRSLRGEQLGDPLEKLVSAAETSQRSSK
jgi:thiol-disulfide isomerase/thioredoxin